MGQTDKQFGGFLRLVTYRTHWRTEKRGGTAAPAQNGNGKDKITSKMGSRKHNPNCDESEPQYRQGCVEKVIPGSKQAGLYQGLDTR